MELGPINAGNLRIIYVHIWALRAKPGKVWDFSFKSYLSRVNGSWSWATSFAAVSFYTHAFKNLLTKYKLALAWKPILTFLRFNWGWLSKSARVAFDITWKNRNSQCKRPHIHPKGKVFQESISWMTPELELGIVPPWRHCFATPLSLQCDACIQSCPTFYKYVRKIFSLVFSFNIYVALFINFKEDIWWLEWLTERKKTSQLQKHTQVDKKLLFY